MKKVDDKKPEASPTTVEERIKTKLYENRVIFFSTEIDEKNSLEFVKTLHSMYYENASPINIKLTTHGGYFTHSSRMVASIEEVKKKAQINCECAGTVASGGIDILLPCSRRLSHPTTTFLIHHHHGGDYGRYDQKVDMRKEDDLVAEMRVKHLAKYSNLSYEEAWDKMDRKEWFLTPEEMLSYEMIDEVL